MTLVDLGIVALLAVNAVSGFRRGLVRSACSLGGLVLGLALAAWNYGRLATLLAPILRWEALADAVGFLLIAALASALARFLGDLLAQAVRMIGLGLVDRLAGALFGVFQGAVAVTLLLVVLVAFFPPMHALARAQLARHFFAACHLSAELSPEELARRLRHGLHQLELETPHWMHPIAEN